MKGVYTVSQRITALASAKTLMYLLAPASKVVEILSASVTNESNATNEQLRCSLKRITTFGNPSGTFVTPATTEPGDQASLVTACGNLTNEPGAYGTVLDQQGFSSIGGYFYDPLPEEREYLAPSGFPGSAIGLVMETAPTSATYDVMVRYREIG